MALLDGHIALDRLNPRLPTGRHLPNQNLQYSPDGDANRGDYCIIEGRCSIPLWLGRMGSEWSLGNPPMKKSPGLRKPARVFIADSSSMGCQLMVRALQQSRQPIRVVGSATESTQILKGLGENPSDVVIISADLRDGRSTGLCAVREARLSYPHTRIIVLVDSPNASWLSKRFGQGPTECSLVTNLFEMLCKCIRAVCAGQIWARSDQLRFVIEAMAKTEPQAIKGANGTKLLTKREEELVDLVAEGLTNRDISRQLSLTEHTVRNYLFRIFNKLGTSNRLELALYVIKQRGTERSTDLGGELFGGFAVEVGEGRLLRDRPS